jgi:hypothetical protein
VVQDDVPTFCSKQVIQIGNFSRTAVVSALRDANFLQTLDGKQRLMYTYIWECAGLGYMKKKMVMLFLYISQKLHF